ncbi:MAG: ABC transporter permease [Actinomycetota bacterium]
MSTVVVFALLGVGTGALYGALAAGIIVAYRGSGVVNFAVGAMAMFTAIVFAELRTSGDLLLPVVLIPDRWSLGDPMPTVPAALLALAVGTALSASIYRFVIRPMRFSPKVTMVVATVGITIVLQALAVRSFGSQAVRTPSLLPRGTIEVLGSTVPVDRFYVVGIVLLIAVVARFVETKTIFGLATRAAFLNEKGAILLGFDPNRLGLLNWLIGSTIGSVVGILATSLGGINPFSFSLFVVPALGAALAGRLTSIPIAVVAGIAIGAFEAIAVHIVARRWVPDFFLGGITQLVPFTVIVLAIALLGRTLPDRSVLVEQANTTAVRDRFRPALWWPVIGLAMFGVLSSDATIRFATLQSAFVLVLVSSIVVLTGFAGQVSLAQLSFAGFSAFMLSRLDSALPFPLAPAAAVALTVVVGTLLGLPALRVRGVQFAVVTFAIAVVFDELLFRSPSFVGTTGIATVKSPTLFGIDLGIAGTDPFPSRRFGVLVVITVTIVMLGVHVLRSGPIGRRFAAVRANERAAAAGGISVTRTKLLAAALSSGLAGIAGVIFAYKAQTLTGAGLDAQEGLELLALAYLGGIGSLAGAVIAAALAPSGVVAVVIFGGGSSITQFLLTGLGLIVVAVALPDGLAGIGRSIRRRVGDAIGRPVEVDETRDAHPWTHRPVAPRSDDATSGTRGDDPDPAPAISWITSDDD